MRLLEGGDIRDTGHDEAERVLGKQLGVQFGVLGNVMVRVCLGEHHIVLAAAGEGGAGFGVDLQHL